MHSEFPASASLKYVNVIARARAELEILHVAQHGLGTGDADNIDSLARERVVAI